MEVVKSYSHFATLGFKSCLKVLRFKLFMDWPDIHNVPEISRLVYRFDMRPFALVIVPKGHSGGRGGDGALKI